MPISPSYASSDENAVGLFDIWISFIIGYRRGVFVHSGR